MNFYQHDVFLHHIIEFYLIKIVFSEKSQKSLKVVEMVISIVKYIKVISIVKWYISMV